MSQIPRAEKGLICPLHKQDMSKVCHKCPLWVLVRGRHPQSNEDIDAWKCSLAWLPFLMIENSAQQRSTAAAVESLRNETMTASGEMTEMLAVAAGLRARPQLTRGANNG